MLFVGEGNVSRSIMAEALLARLGGGSFHAYSAGRNPGRQISAHAQEALRQAGYHTEDLHPKSWNEFVSYTGPAMDVVVTLDNGLKNGPFPIWFNTPVYVHWPFADPQTASHEDLARQGAHRRLFSEMEQQIRKLTALDLKGLRGAALRAALMSIAPKG